MQNKLLRISSYMLVSASTPKQSESEGCFILHFIWQHIWLYGSVLIYVFQTNNRKRSDVLTGIKSQSQILTPPQ